MAVFLLLIFLLVPLIEIGLFIQIGGAFGLWPTLAVVIATAFAGSFLLRRQGMGVLARARIGLDQGVFPADELFHGVCLLLAGGLLIVPGFFTDGLGILLFFPVVRRMLGEMVKRHIHSTAEQQGWTQEQPGDVIEGDYREINPNEGRNRRPEKSDPNAIPPPD